MIHIPTDAGSTFGYAYVEFETASIALEVCKTAAQVPRTRGSIGVTMRAVWEKQQEEIYNRLSSASSSKGSKERGKRERKSTTREHGKASINGARGKDGEKKGNDPRNRGGGKPKPSHIKEAGKREAGAAGNKGGVKGSSPGGSKETPNPTPKPGGDKVTARSAQHKKKEKAVSTPAAGIGLRGGD